MSVSADAAQIVMIVLAEIEIRQCLLSVESITAMLPTWGLTRPQLAIAELRKNGFISHDKVKEREFFDTEAFDERYEEMLLHERKPTMQYLREIAPVLSGTPPV